MTKKNDRVEFENGMDLLRGTVIGRYLDPNRPDMEETWTVYADEVLIPVFADQVDETHPKKPTIKVLARHDVIRLVDDDGVQACDKNGIALHKGKTGEPLQLVKHGVPVPFRVRARRMKTL